MIKQDSFILLWLESVSINNYLSSDTDLVFENLDLRIDSGEYASVSGIYGSDKISFINVLGCLSKPRAGKYIFDYNDIATIGSEKLKSIRSRHIGFLFKGLNIIDDLSAYKNIALPLLHLNDINIHKEVSKVAEGLGLAEVLHKKARELSDLQRHKVAIARALIINPILILADEPGEGLSKQDKANVLDILSNINKNGTAVISFSDKEEVIVRASRHIVFEKGRIKTDSIFVNNGAKEGVV